MELTRNQRFHLRPFAVRDLTITLIEGKLSWLPQFLQEHIVDPVQDLQPMLNTVLVFARARTSTFESISSWNAVALLVKGLNAAADAVGASHHRLEMVHQTRRSYFVTCSNSPRFNWNLSLSHREIGENLDYFAPGHNRVDSTKYAVYFIEKESFEELTGECVLPEYLTKEDWKELKRFNDVREHLYNQAMTKLGLSYRFKYLVTKPGTSTAESVQHMMKQSTAPSPDWWEEHCFYVNGFLLPGIMLHSQFAFCGFDTKYDRYWLFIQSTFQFMVKYKRYEYWQKAPETGPISWKSFEILCRRIRRNCAQDLEEPDYIRFFEETQKEFRAIEEWAKGLKAASSPELSIPVRHRAQLSRFRFAIGQYVNRLWTLKATASLYISNRHRLRTRLVRQSVACPESGERKPGR